MLRDAPLEPPTREWDEAEALTNAVVQTAHDAGVRVLTVAAEPGHLRGLSHGHGQQIAQTDFAATYLAIGLGLDPAVSPHVADLRDRTRG